MTEYEAYQEHIRYTHDTYCRIVIRHASFDAARMLAARWKREISLEYLTEEKFVPLSTIDEYFQVPDYGETYPYATFQVQRTLPGPSGAAWATPCYSVSVCSRPAASASPCSVPIEKGAFEWRM